MATIVCKKSPNNANHKKHFSKNCCFKGLGPKGRKTGTNDHAISWRNLPALDSYHDKEWLQVKKDLEYKDYLSIFAVHLRA